MSKLPVTIFTGFLGSGKTTLLSSLLASEREPRFAIVVNEFGAVSVDALLLQRARGAPFARVFPLTKGLIAYAGDDFLATMLAISDDAQLFDHVLVETSGLAVPTAVLEALQNAALQARFVHDATLTIVDTPLLLSGAYDTPANQHASLPNAAAMEVFQQQLMCADVVVLNKIDHCAEDDLLRAEAGIRARASAVRFVECAWHACLDARLVLGLHLNEFRAPIPGSGMAGGQTPGSAHTHSGLAAHEHGLLSHEHMHEEDPGWLSFVLRSQMAQTPEVLQEALETITAQEPVLRLKGFAYVPNSTGHLLVQGVRDRITCTQESLLPLEHDTSQPRSHTPAHQDAPHQHGHVSAHHHSQGTMAELVFIGYHLDRHTVTAKLCQHTETVWL